MPEVSSQKVVLITGASSGIGAAAARAFAKAGYKVFAAARRMDKLAALEADGIAAVQLDVTDDSSMVAAVTHVQQTAGRIDVLINNAGYGAYGSVEDVSMVEARRQLETNVLGLARMCQLVVPMMREAGHGVILNVSSVVGVFGLPLAGWYHASKYAVEGLSDSMGLELAPFGIRVVAIQPGAIVTEWSGIAADNLLKASGNGAYGEVAARKAAGTREMSGSKIASRPEVVADAMVRIAQLPQPRQRYAVGGGAPFLTTMRKILSDRQFYWMVRKIMK